MAENYETVIGLEVHVQLATKSKAFCGDSVRFGSDVNSQVSPISLAHPGTLPKVNRSQIAYAVRLGLAVGGRINTINTFDRKNYFYPDLPKGYQITQDAAPIVIGGHLPIFIDGKWKEIGIHHIHMEEDAGKSIHDHEDAYSRVDLNRAGVPLLEIVTEPDLRSAAEVEAFMAGIRQLVRYLGVSDGNMQEGSLRCDVNVSIRPEGEERYGNRCEIKNLNSMRFARKAIAFEVARQKEIIASGSVVKQETLNFDPQSGATTPLRSKETLKDYRYFPDPDLPIIELQDSFIDAQREMIAELPWEVFQRLQKEFGFDAKDAAVLSEDPLFSDFFFSFVRMNKDAKMVKNLCLLKIRPYLQSQKISVQEFPVELVKLNTLIELIQNKEVSQSMVYDRVFPELLRQPNMSIIDLVKDLDVLQSNDDSMLLEIISSVLDAQPEKVKAYQKGKKGLLGFFMGEVMKKSKGKFDPKRTNEILREQLNKD